MSGSRPAGDRGGNLTPLRAGNRHVQESSPRRRRGSGGRGRVPDLSRRAGVRVSRSRSHAGCRGGSETRPYGVEHYRPRGCWRCIPGSGPGSGEVDALLDTLMAGDWVVYTKHCLEPTGTVVEYLARYTHRISSHRDHQCPYPRCGRSPSPEVDPYAHHRSGKHSRARVSLSAVQSGPTTRDRAVIDTTPSLGFTRLPTMARY